MRACLARSIAGCRQLGSGLFQLAGLARGRADQRRCLSRTVAGALGRSGHFLARRVDLLRGRRKRLHVLHSLIGGTPDRPQRAVNRNQQRELRRQELEEIAVGLAVHRGVGVPHAPEPYQLAGVVQRDEHFRARRLGAWHDDLIFGEAMRDDGAAQSQRLARQTGVGIEAEWRSRLRRGVGDELHLPGASVVAGKSHLFPGHELAGQLLYALEALCQRQLGGDHLSEPLNQVQLVRAHAEAQHLEAARRADQQRAKQQRACSDGNGRVHDRQPAERQRRRNEIDDRFPAEREPGIYPRDRLAEGQLQIERAVHDERQHYDGHRNDPGVLGGQRGGPRCAAQPEIHPADECGSRRQVRRIS